MLNIVFAITGNNIVSRYRACEANARLLRLLNKDCKITLILGNSTADSLSVKTALFDKVYETTCSDNQVEFLANSLPRIPGDQIFYLNENLFSFTEIHNALGRNLVSGVYIPNQVLDFRGNSIDAAGSWTAQQLMQKHQWPVVMAPAIWFNKDDKSLEFFSALEMCASSWHTLGTEHSDAAMANPTLDNILSFACLTQSENYQKTNLLNFRHFGRRDFSRDANWIHKDWYDWLDTWWVSKDGTYLRVENFRQQGFVFLGGDYIERVEQWLEKISH